MVERPINCDKPDTIFKYAKQTAQESQSELLKYFKSVLTECVVPDKEIESSKGVKTVKKKKRRPSGYNLFIGGCMKPTAHYLGKPMKEGAADWKTADKDSWNQKAKGGT